MSFSPLREANSAPQNPLAGFEPLRGHFAAEKREGKGKEDKGKEKEKRDGKDRRKNTPSSRYKFILAADS